MTLPKGGYGGFRPPEPTDDELYEESAREHAITVFDLEDVETITAYIRDTLDYDPMQWLIEHIGLDVYQIADSAVERLQYLAKHWDAE